MHCDLIHHHIMHYPPRQQSKLFLENITDKKYPGLANSLMFHLTDKLDDVAAPFYILALLDCLVNTSNANILNEMDLPAVPPPTKSQPSPSPTIALQSNMRTTTPHPQLPPPRLTSNDLSTISQRTANSHRARQIEPSQMISGRTIA